LSPMHTEQQTEQIVSAPGIAPVSESGESKPSKRGGRRPGAGRKPNLAKHLLRGFSREAIAEAASTIDCGAVLVGLLKSKKEKTRMEALVFLRDTVIGRQRRMCSFLVACFTRTRFGVPCQP
jgi:hypothetical protein